MKHKDYITMKTIFTAEGNNKHSILTNDKIAWYFLASTLLISYMQKKRENSDEIRFLLLD